MFDVGSMVRDLVKEVRACSSILQPVGIKLTGFEFSSFDEASVSLNMSVCQAPES